MSLKIKLKRTDCNACGEYMVPDKHQYYTCPACGAEFVPPGEDTKITKKAVLACVRNEFVSEPLMQVKSSKGRGKGAKGKSRQQEMKKPACSTLFKKLFKET